MCVFRKNILKDVVIVYDGSKVLFFSLKKGKKGSSSLGEKLDFKISDVGKFGFIELVNLLSEMTGLNTKKFFCSTMEYETAFLFYKEPFGIFPNY